jgi:hypothetical protein
VFIDADMLADIAPVVSCPATVIQEVSVGQQK